MPNNIETRCIHGTEKEKNPYGAISYPIFQSATFAHPGVGQSTGYDYSRLQNPTREHLEHIVASLENGIDALAFSSGMAAITTLMEIFQSGDHLIVEEDLYGGSIRLFEQVCQNRGITFTYLDMTKGSVEDAIQENTKAIYIETPTNPMMHVADIKKLAEIAHEHQALLLVDNTFLSPYLQNPLDLGADVVIHSGTKYLSGHNDTIAGFLVTNSEALSEKFRFLIKTTGAMLAPFDSWLLIRGIQTLAVRMNAAQSNAKKIVEWLQEQKSVTKVYYPGIPGSQGYDIMKQQARGFGAMITFEVESKELAHQILQKIQIIQFAESLGGTESLLTYPITQTHADVPPEQLKKNGITDRLLRMSVGIENVDDLLNDLQQAFGI